MILKNPFKKKEIVSEEEVKVQEFLDLIAPSTIRFFTEYLFVEIHIAVYGQSGIILHLQMNRHF